MTRIDGLRWGGPPDRRSGGWTGDVWLGCVLVPERQDDPYLEELRLGDIEFQHELLALMTGTILQPRLETDIAERRDHIEFVQRDAKSRRVVATTEAYADGTLVWRSVVPRRPNAPSLSLADMHVIDEDAVWAMIARLLAFARRYYQQRRIDPGAVYLGVSLSDIAFKHFGKLPTYLLSSFTITSISTSRNGGEGEGSTEPGSGTTKKNTRTLDISCFFSLSGRY